MTEAATKKFNFPEQTTYLEMPRAFFGKKQAGGGESPFKGLNSNARSLLALIHTENKKAGVPAKLTFDYIVSRLGGSKETWSKYKQQFINKGIIEEVARSRYKIIAEYSPTPFFKVKDFLFKEVVEMHEDENRARRYQSFRVPTRKAIIIANFVAGMEELGEFTSSQARIGVALDMPRTTAGDGIRELSSAQLMKCIAPTDPRDIAAGLTKYEVDGELKDVKFIEPKPKAEDDEDAEDYGEVKALFDDVEPKQKKPQRKQTRDELEAVALQDNINRATIERHYYDLRHKAEARAEAVLAKAMADSEYAGINARLRELGKLIAFEQNPQRAQELEAERNELEVRGERRLKAIGIDKAELKPRYKCSICGDTGYDSRGNPCKCMAKLVKQLENNRI